jgi:hypothetical protein
MRLVIALFVSLLVAGSAVAADIAKGPAVVEGTVTQYQNQINRADVLVVSIIQATFSDQGPTWAAAFGGADLVYDPLGAYGDLTGYNLILVDTADMWWSYAFAADEAVWESYHTAGGCVWVVGQDYLYSRLSQAGFPQTVLGMVSASEDIAWDTTTIEWSGAPGSPLDGMAGTTYACFASNGFFTDDVTAATQYLADWVDELGAGGSAGCVGTDAGLSTLEFGCDAQVGAVAAAIYGFCGGPIPTEETSWGQIKSMYNN